MKLLALVLALGCSGSVGLPTCISKIERDGTATLGLGELCLHGVRASALSGGSFRPAAIRLYPSGAGLAITVVAPPPVEALRLELPGLPGSAMLQQGVQSWSFAGSIQIPGEVPLAPDGAPALAAARTGSPLDEVAGVSYGATVIGAPGGAAIVIGTLDPTHVMTGIAAVARDGLADVTAIHGAAREPLAAGSEGLVESAPFYVAQGASARQALVGYAVTLAESLGTPAPRRPPGGWFSWNERFAHINQDFIRAHAERVATDLLPHGLTLVEIDDGWERAWGDWRDNDRFADGLPALATELRAQGLVPGVWMAPFLVDVRISESVGVTADMLVKGEDGAPLRHSPSGGGGTYHVLDGTSGKARDFMADSVRRLSGFGFFKLDFLYAGALPGRRSDPAATGVEALRAGLKAIRAAMPEGAVLNACGAPIFSVLGLADSLRVGSDTAFDGVALAWPDVAFAARSHAARAFLSPIVWPDADQAQLRPPYDEDEALASAAVAALAGPAYGLGDDLTRLDPARLALGLDPALLDLFGAREPAQPLDPLDPPAKDVVLSPVVDAFVAADGTKAPPPAIFEGVGGSGTTYRLTFSWTGPRKVTIERR